MRKWIVLPAAAALAVSGIGAAQAVTGWDQDFTNGTEGWFDSTNGWYGTIAQVESGSNGITSVTGGHHAEVNGTKYGPFSRFAGYSSTWDGDYIAELDIYLDPSWVDGTGFDYSVAASRSELDAEGNTQHLRDFIFHVAKDTDTGDLLVGGSNNTNFSPREDLEHLEDLEPHKVTEAGWYTFQHVFREDNGVLAVDLNLVDAEGSVLWTETRRDDSDTIGEGGAVGGNRYSWFTFVTVEDLAVDNHRLFSVPTGPASKDDCKDGAWESFHFENQGQCIAGLTANEAAGK